MGFECRIDEHHQVAESLDVKLTAVIAPFGAYGAILKDLPDRRLHHQSAKAVADNNQLGLTGDLLACGDKFAATVFIS